MEGMGRHGPPKKASEMNSSLSLVDSSIIVLKVQTDRVNYPTQMLVGKIHTTNVCAGLEKVKESSEPHAEDRRMCVLGSRSCNSEHYHEPKPDVLLSRCPRA
jgi:hypothetical protein